MYACGTWVLILGEEVILRIMVRMLDSKLALNYYDWVDYHKDFRFI